MTTSRRYTVSPARCSRFYRRWLIAVPLSLATVLGTPGCNTKTSDRDVVMVAGDEAERMQSGRGTLLRKSKRAIFVDPRREYEFRESRIPGAMHIPLEDLRDHRPELAAYDIVIVYGTGYRSPIAIAAAKTLLDMKLPDVRMLEGGLQGWERSGRDVDRE